ncbi:hypothetical protein EVAR_68280_1 [Eumeta japonica]|uniref:Uncharacterized protein n=1 Tax=Eumeta variegata TaxID=151549 RepID=A0A4C1ZT44_EUMVA|nr:hypothetical protein EVAR_68280_1 [Eumeta japonica]
MRIGEYIFEAEMQDARRRRTINHGRRPTSDTAAAPAARRRRPRPTPRRIYIIEFTAKFSFSVKYRLDRPGCVRARSLRMPAVRVFPIFPGLLTSDDNTGSRSCLFVCL